MVGIYNDMNIVQEKVNKSNVNFEEKQLAQQLFTIQTAKCNIAGQWNRRFLVTIYIVASFPLFAEWQTHKVANTIGKWTKTGGLWITLNRGPVYLCFTWGKLKMTVDKRVGNRYLNGVHLFLFSHILHDLIHYHWPPKQIS